MLKEKFLFLFKQRLSGSKVVKVPHQKHSDDFVSIIIVYHHTSSFQNPFS